MLKQPVTLL